jgi:hypothetical protein
MNELEISVNGQPPRPGSVEIVHEGGLLHWSGHVAGMHGLGVRAHLSFMLGGRFYAGPVMFLQMSIPADGETDDEQTSRFQGHGPLDRFEIWHRPTEEELADRRAAVRLARAAAEGRAPA